MAVKDFMNPGVQPRQQAVITTVDPSQRICQGALKDGGGIHIAIWDTPTLFRWPQVGEVWFVYKESGIWKLEGAVDPTEVHSDPVETMAPGDVRIIAPHGDISISTTDGTYGGKVATIYSTTIGDGIATVYNVKHNFNTLDVGISIRQMGTPPLNFVSANMAVIQDTNTVRLTFSTPPAIHAYRVTVWG